MNQIVWEAEHTFIPSKTFINSISIWILVIGDKSSQIENNEPVHTSPFWYLKHLNNHENFKI